MLRLKLFYFLFLFAFLQTKSAIAATNLNVLNTYTSSTSLTFSWNNTNSSWIVALSTTNDFSSLIATGSVTSNTTTYINLSPDTKYYFRVKISNENDDAYLINQISTITLAAQPVNLSFVASYADSSTDAQLLINFDKLNPPWTRYKIRYSSGTTDNYSYVQGTPPLVLGKLLANTTYNIDVTAINQNGIETSPSVTITTATLAQQPPLITHSVFETSATIIWSALPPTPQNETAEGYKIILSTMPNFENSIAIWTTTDINTNSKTFTGLERNTTYYYRMGTLNWNNEFNSRPKLFTTLTSTPSNFSFISISSTHAKFSWSPYPVSPSSASALGYRLEASTYPNFSFYLFSTTYDLNLSTLTIGILEPNTTYYFRVAALNSIGEPNYSNVISTSTLSIPHASSDIGYILSTMSITAFYVTLSPPPGPFSCSGYVFEISTSPFDGGIVYSSTTYDSQNSRLTIENLRPNTTYYARIGTLNNSYYPNYSPVSILKTLMPGPAPSVILSEIYSSSAVIVYSTIPSDGYIVEASSDEFKTVSASSITFNPLLNKLIISGLNPNTLYYFRHGSIFNGATSYIETIPYSKYTLSNPVSGASIQNVYISSITLSWTQVSSCNGYQIEASTSSNWQGVIFSSLTLNSNQNSLTVESLAPNTSYYLRIGSINAENAKNYTYLSATSTLANYPVQILPFTTQDLSTNTIKIKWDANSNPPDTLYKMEISSNSDFSPPVYSSNTFNTFAFFDSSYGLIPNTTYYQRITAFNRLNRATPTIQFSAVATLAYDPEPKPYTNLYKSSVTLNWGPGLNPPGTLFLAEISSTNFIDSIISSVTLSTSATFYNLLSNTSYYLRVSALNHSGIPSNYVSLSTALTDVEEPAKLPPENTFMDIKVDGFKVKWLNNGNSSFTIYSVEISSDQNFSFFNSSASTLNTYFTFSELESNVTYYVRVRAKGLNGNLTNWVLLGSTTTIGYVQKSAIVNENTTITLPYSYGDITIYVPKDALGGTTKVYAYPCNSFPASNDPNLKSTNIGVRLYNFPVTVFKNAVTITIPYQLSQVPPGLDPKKFILAVYSESSGMWLPLISVSDTVNHKVSGKTYHFSLFQIMELTPGANLSNIKIYPNPYKPNTHFGYMNFTNMPPHTKIKIYTITGELVRKLKANESGMTYWDALNENKEKVATGIYIAIFETPDGSKKIKKIAVER